MIRQLLIITFFLFYSSVSTANINLNFQDATLQEIVQTYSKAILEKDYILSPAVQSSTKKLTISLNNKTSHDVKSIIHELLTDNGVYYKEVGGIIYFTDTPNNVNEEGALQDMSPLSSPPSDAVILSDEELLLDESMLEVHYYQPQYIQPDQLQKILNAFNVQQSTIVDNKIIYKATDKTQEKIADMLLALDLPTDQFEVIAATYEVSKQDDSQRSIDIIGEIFKNVGISILTSGANNIVKFTGSSLSAAFKFFDSDTRFRSISKPYATVKSGESMRFQSGQDVPILGNITTNNNITQQSIEYRQSGVILDVELHAVKDAIDLKINHELSNFVQTRIGVNASPTLNKQSLNTSVTMHDKEILVIGGLTTKSGTVSSTNALGLIPTERIKTTKDTETYVFLQVNKL